MRDRVWPRLYLKFSQNLKNKFNLSNSKREKLDALPMDYKVLWLQVNEEPAGKQSPASNDALGGIDRLVEMFKEGVVLENAQVISFLYLAIAVQPEVWSILILELGLIERLCLVLFELGSKVTLSDDELQLQYKAIKIVNSVLVLDENSALQLVLFDFVKLPVFSKVVKSFVLCVDSKSCKTSKIAYKFLSMLLNLADSEQVNDMHNAVLEAFDFLKYARQYRQRFECLVKRLKFDARYDMQSNILILINALINTPESLEKRIAIRSEFFELNLEHLLELLKDSSPGEEVNEQLHVFENDLRLDNEEIAERIRMSSNVSIDMKSRDGLIRSLADYVNDKLQLHTVFYQTIKHLLLMPRDGEQALRVWYLLEKLIRQIAFSKRQLLVGDVQLNVDELMLLAAEDRAALETLQRTFLLKEEQLSYQLESLTLQLAERDAKIVELKNAIASNNAALQEEYGRARLSAESAARWQDERNELIEQWQDERNELIEQYESKELGLKSQLQSITLDYEQSLIDRANASQVKSDLNASSNVNVNVEDSVVMMKNQVESMREECKKEKQKMHEQCSELQRQLKSVQADNVRELEEHIKQADCQRHELIESYGKQKQAQDAIIEELRVEAIRKSEELERVREQLQRTADESAEDYRKLLAVEKAKKDRMIDTLKREHEASIESAEQARNSLMKQIITLQEQYASLQDQYATLKSKLQSINERANIVDTSASEGANNTQINIDKSNVVLMAQLNKFKRKNYYLKNSVIELKKKIQAIESSRGNGNFGSVGHLSSLWNDMIKSASKSRTTSTKPKFLVWPSSSEDLNDTSVQFSPVQKSVAVNDIFSNVNADEESNAVSSTKNLHTTDSVPLETIGTSMLQRMTLCRTGAIRQDELLDGLLKDLVLLRPLFGTNSAFGTELNIFETSAGPEKAPVESTPIDQSESVKNESTPMDQSESVKNESAPALAPPPPPPPISTGAPMPPPPPISAGVPMPPPPGQMRGKVSGPVPSVSMRNYQWTKIPANQVSKTIFNSLDPAKVDLNVKQLESMFCLQKSASKGQPLKKEAGDKDLQFSVLDSRRLQNVGIFLQTFKMSVTELEDVVLMLDESVLTQELTQMLLNNFPTASEVSAMNEYLESGGELKRMQSVNVFLYNMSKIPQGQQRLECLLFKHNFSVKSKECAHLLMRLKKANIEFLSAQDTFNKLMEIVLAIGNFLNHGTTRGSAVGFRLESLLKLSEVKSTTGSDTLLHHIISFVEERYPHVLEWHSNLNNLGHASKVVFKLICDDVVGLRKSLKITLETSKNIVKSDSRWDIFHSVFPSFIADAMRELETLEALQDRVSSDFNQILTSYSYPKETQPEEFYGLLETFVSQFKKIQIEIKLKESKQQANKSSQLRTPEQTVSPPIIKPPETNKSPSKTFLDIISTESPPASGVDSVKIFEKRRLRRQNTLRQKRLINLINQ